MIKALRKKMIFSTMIVVMIVVFILLCIVNVFNLITLNLQANALLDEVIAYYIQTPSEPSSSDSAEQITEAESTEEADPVTGTDGDSSGSLEELRDDLPEITVNKEYGFDITGKNAHIFSFLYPDIKLEDVLGAMFFTVTLSPAGEVIDVDVNRTQEEPGYASNMAIALSREYEKEGWMEKCKYRVVEDQDGNEIYVFLHRDRDLENWYRVLGFSCIALLIFFFAILLVTIFVSKKMLEPVEENIEKQKNFITNASHELKTPLAIIQTNAEALELYNGKNKWTSNINEQIGRLSVMLNHMLTLSRTEEGAVKNAQEEVDLTTVTEELLPMYRTSVEQNNITLFKHIEDSMPVRSSRAQIEQLVTILLDNAIKYALKGSTVEVHIYTRDRNTIFETVNRCEHLPDCEPNRLFERFFRPDSSRYSDIPGNGIGLSAAQAIVNAYGGTISCKYEGKDTIHFTVIFHR